MGANNNVRQQIDIILNQHHAVFHAIRDAGTAITAAIEANQAALRLLRDLPETK